MQVSAKPFSREQLPALLQLLGDNAGQRWPAATPLMNSDIAWQLPFSNPKVYLMLWYLGEELAAFSWFQPNSHLLFDVREGHSQTTLLIEKILDHAISVRRSHPAESAAYLNFQSMDEWADALRTPTPDSHEKVLITSSLDADTVRRQCLSDKGFVQHTHHEPYLSRDLDEIPPQSTEGFSYRAVTENELQKYVETHRAAWAPSTGFSQERYQSVRAITSVFKPSLNLVAEAANGDFAACAIFWMDPVSKVGSIEPFGSHPAFRGKGVSQDLIHAGLRAMKEEGMHSCRVYTAGFNTPAQHLYQSCGFIRVDRSQTFTLAME